MTEAGFAQVLLRLAPQRSRLPAEGKYRADDDHEQAGEHHGVLDAGGSLVVGPKTSKGVHHRYLARPESHVENIPYQNVGHVPPLGKPQPLAQLQPLPSLPQQPQFPHLFVIMSTRP